MGAIYCSILKNRFTPFHSIVYSPRRTISMVNKHIIPHSIAGAFNKFLFADLTVEGKICDGTKPVSVCFELNRVKNKIKLIIKWVVVQRQPPKEVG